jgi:hypothetical protein
VSAPVTTPLSSLTDQALARRNGFFLINVHALLFCLFYISEIKVPVEDVAPGAPWHALGVAYSLYGAGVPGRARPRPLAGAPAWTGCAEHDVLRQAAWMFWRDIVPAILERLPAPVLARQADLKGVGNLDNVATAQGICGERLPDMRLIPEVPAMARARIATPCAARSRAR